MPEASQTAQSMTMDELRSIREGYRARKEALLGRWSEGGAGTRGVAATLRG